MHIQPSRRAAKGKRDDAHLGRHFFARVVTHQTVEGKHRDGSLRTSEQRAARGSDLLPGMKVEDAGGVSYRVAQDGSLRGGKLRRPAGISARQARRAAKRARPLAGLNTRA